MSFKRYREIYRPMMRHRVEAGREAASRWVGPEPSYKTAAGQRTVLLIVR